MEEDSIIGLIFKSNVVENVPSWHHQAVKSVDGTSLKVTAVTETDGYPIIECIERTDKTMIIGFQFHPEAALVKHKNGVDNAENYMKRDLAILPFTYLIDGVAASK